MRKLMACLLFATLGIVSAAAEESQMIVKDGKPNAQIVIAAENRPRMATLAALLILLVNLTIHLGAEEGQNWKSE
jgi:hypothetical protein